MTIIVYKTKKAYILGIGREGEKGSGFCLKSYKDKRDILDTANNLADYLNVELIYREEE